jgi:hypothetical protein
MPRSKSKISKSQSTSEHKKQNARVAKKQLDLEKQNEIAPIRKAKSITKPLAHALRYLSSIPVLTPQGYLSMCESRSDDALRPRSVPSARSRLDRLVWLGLATYRVGTLGAEYRVDTTHPDYHPSEATLDLVAPGDRADVSTLSVRPFIIAQTAIYNAEYARYRELPDDADFKLRKAFLVLLSELSDSIRKLYIAESTINPGADFDAITMDIPGLTTAPADENGRLVAENAEDRRARLEVLQGDLGGD